MAPGPNAGDSDSSIGDAAEPPTDDGDRSAAPPSSGPISKPPYPDEGVGEDETADGDQPATDEEEKRSLPVWLEIPLLVLLALVIAVVIKTFLVQAFYIPSGSMESTLNINDRILVNKLAFRFGDPHRGDVVVFDSGRDRDESLLESIRRNIEESIGVAAPESDFIKRVVGLPGETLEIRDNQVFIDGVPLEEPYLKSGTNMPDFGPVAVEPDHYFMMGDNRNLSSDSRFNGAVARDRLVGRAFVIVWPPANWGGL